MRIGMRRIWRGGIPWIRGHEGGKEQLRIGSQMKNMEMKTKDDDHDKEKRKKMMTTVKKEMRKND